MSWTANFLAQSLPFMVAAGAMAQLVRWGVNRGWGVVSGVERLERAAADVRERLAVCNETFTTAKRRADDIEKQLELTEQRIKALERDAKRLAAAPPCFVHVIGEPGADKQAFRANLTRDASGAAKRGDGSPIWRYANYLTVYAPDRDSARAQAEHLFPEKMGYLKVFMN